MRCSSWHEALELYRTQEWDMAELQLLNLQDDLARARIFTIFSSSASLFCAPILPSPAGTAPSRSRPNNDEAQNTRVQRRHRRRPAHDLDAARQRRADRRGHRRGRPHDRRAARRSTTSSSRIRTWTTSRRIPFLVDTVGWMREKPITVYATRETLADPAASIFSTGSCGPTSPQIPDRGNADAALPDDRGRRAGRRSTGARITALPANHVVPGGRLSVRHRARRAWSSPATRRRTMRCGPQVNKIENLRYLIIETALSEPGARARDRLEAPVPEPARRGAGEAHSAHPRSTSRT